MAESLRAKAFHGTVWASLDRLGILALQFIVNVILARLLTPADFGYIGMIAIFLAVSQVFIDGGFGSALIQKKEPTDEDYSTIFYFNIGVSVFIYAILFFCAPWIASFFHLPLLTEILRILGLTLIINALAFVQNNRLRKQLSFRSMAWINVGSYLFASLIAILMAFNGFGVWSLVFLQVIYSFVQNVLLWTVVRWFPLKKFSIKAFRLLFGFGGYILASNIIQEICRNLQGLVIGRLFSASQLGYYTQAKKLDDVFCYTLPQILVQVIFPLYARFQDNLQRLNEILGLSMRIVSYFIFPLMMLLIIIADPLIYFIFGEKWIMAVPYFRILCVGGFFICLQNITYYAVASVGNADSLFRWSFYKWGVYFVLLMLGTIWGMDGIMWSLVISNFNIAAVNSYLVKKFIGFSLKKQILELLPSLTLCICCGGGILLFDTFTDRLNELIFGVLFLVFYFTLSYFLHMKVIKDISLLKNIVFNKNAG